MLFSVKRLSPICMLYKATETWYIYGKHWLLPDSSVGTTDRKRIGLFHFLATIRIINLVYHVVVVLSGTVAYYVSVPVHTTQRELDSSCAGYMRKSRRYITGRNGKDWQDG